MSSNSVTRRSEVDCFILGAPSKLKNSVLPTYLQVLRYIVHVRYTLLSAGTAKQPAISKVFAIVSKDVKKIWESASIPTVSTLRVIQLLTKEYNEYLKLKRWPEKKRNTNFDVRVQTFQNRITSGLFDIAACKCKLLTSCCCSQTNKVPPKEQDFLNDQRTDRKMIIGTVDLVETRKLQKRASRILKRQQTLQTETSIAVQPEPPTRRQLIKTIPPPVSEETPMSNEPSTSGLSRCKNNKIPIPVLATMCDRYGISDRSAAAVATAVLQDFGLVTSKDKSLVIDKNKVRRARETVRHDMQEKTLCHNVEGIYFDGRKDKTLEILKKDNRYHRTISVKEHISLICEPGSLYLGHITPKSGTGKAIADSIMDFCLSTDLKLDKIICIGCDGTVTNTGWKGGAIRHIELKLNRPLQWFVCQLHANELPLRHLFNRLDGNTTGPREYSGPIGKSLEQCQSLPVVDFTPVVGNLQLLQADVINSLSTDQKYLYELSQAISVGSCSSELAHRQPGKMGHSRWLTTANRVLRLYVGTHGPSNNLKMIVDYIMKVYAPVWFSIKKESCAQNGAHHVFKLIKYSRDLCDDILLIIDPVIQRNSFFAHPENLLLAMIFDNRRPIRELGLRRIIEARRVKSNSVRVFKLPKLNFQAADYIDIIIWAESQITPPPILDNVSDKVLKEMVEKERLNDIAIPAFPCHTQAVERCVKLVTEASMAVAGPKARDGLIRTKLMSRSKMPTFNFKGQYKA